MSSGGGRGRAGQGRRPVIQGCCERIDYGDARVDGDGGGGGGEDCAATGEWFPGHLPPPGQPCRRRRPLTRAHNGGLVHASPEPARRRCAVPRARRVTGKSQTRARIPPTTTSPIPQSLLSSNTHTHTHTRPPLRNNLHPTSSKSTAPSL